MHTHFVTKNNKLYGYGCNGCRQLGLARFGHNDTFEEIPLNDNITQINAIYKSDVNTFILTNDGLYGCGDNEFNQLGVDYCVPYKDPVKFVKIPFYKKIINILPCMWYTVIHAVDGLYIAGKIGGTGMIYNKFAKIPFNHEILAIYGNALCLLINSSDGLYIIGKLNDNTNNTFTKLDLFGDIKEVVYDLCSILIRSDAGLFVIGFFNGKKYIGLRQINCQDINNIDNVYYKSNSIIIRRSNKLYAMGENTFNKFSLDDDTIGKPTEIPYQADCVLNTKFYVISSVGDCLYKNNVFMFRLANKIINISPNIIQTSDGLYDHKGYMLMDKFDLFV